MVLLGNILDGAGPLALGAALCYLGFLWRDKATGKAREAEAARSRLEAEQLLQQSRLTAQDEALKLRQEVERSLAARQAEQAETERRLAERETLLNTQFTRFVETEK